MGRGERPPGPAEGPVARFAYELRKLGPDELRGTTVRPAALGRLVVERAGSGRVVLWDGCLHRRLGVLADP